jgi:hypothetical protein
MRGRPARIVSATVLLAAAMGLAAASCARKGAGAPQDFLEGGLSFRYPGDWTVKNELSEVPGGSVRNLTVDDPAHAFVVMMEIKPAVPVDLEQMAGKMLDAMPGAMGDKAGGVFKMAGTSSSPFERSIDGAVRRGIRAHYSVSGAGVDVPHTADFFLLEYPDRVLFLFIQAPDEDRPSAESGFTLILDSLDVAATPS